MEKFYFETFFQLENWGLNAYDSPITLCLKSFYYSYYMSTLPDSPGERHLFSKLLSGAEGEICLTCPGQQQWDNSSCLRWPLSLSLAQSDYNFNGHLCNPGKQSNYCSDASLVSTYFYLN